MPTLQVAGSPGTPIYAGRPTPGGSLLTTLTLENWSGSTTRTLFRGGMPFKKGDVPAGSVPEIRRDGVAVAAQFDERTTWADGSLKFAVCHMRDVDLAAGASATYEIYAVSGSYDNTGATSLASVAAANALTVEFSSLAQWNGTSSATRGSGAALAALVDHAAVATRVTKVHSGPVCEGWMVWGMASDGADGSGSEDAHLKVEWYVDVWKDAGGNIIDVEHAALIAQDWWGVANKFRLDYTATYKRNGSTVQAYTSVQHPYHGHWMTVRLQDDHNHARRHWATAIPTLLYKFSKAYWKNSRIVPPYDLSYTPDSSTAPTYVPLSNIQHRAAIDDTGAYSGRGVLPNFDAKAFMRQTALDNRVARTNAFAGLHYPNHFRDERTRTRSGESADVANTLIPLLWSPKDASASTFTGLPAPKHAYADGRTDLPLQGGYVGVTGGAGVWTPSGDCSHAVAYSTYAYLLEGERYMLNSVIDMATKATHVLVGNGYAGFPTIHWYFDDGARIEMSIPATQWAAQPDTGGGQERSLGWGANLVGQAAAFVPDGDVQGDYLRGWNAHCAEYLQECLLYTPPSLKAAGMMYPRGIRWTRAPWMAAINIQCLYYVHALTEQQGWADYAEMLENFIVALADRSLYAVGAYNTLHSATGELYSASTPYLAANQFLVPNNVTVSANRVSMPGDAGLPPQAGDVVYFLPYDYLGAPTSIPPETSVGTPYYLVDPSGGTFGLATSPGGAAIGTISSGVYFCGCRFFANNGYTPATFPPYLPPGGDQYWSIALAAYAFAELAGSTTTPAGLAAQMEAFLANVDRTDYPAWVMKVEG